MKNLLLFFAVILFFNFCDAKEKPSKNKSDHKLTYEQFIEQYGIDDTCIAIIDIFFDKRLNTSGGKMSFLPLSGAITVAFPPIGISLIAVSSPLFVSGLITRNKYSRKKLMNTLVNYQINNQLSHKHRKRITELMYAEQEMYIEDLLEARYNSFE